MEITVADERVLILIDQVTAAEAEDIAIKNKQNAFGSLNKLTSFFNNPKDEEFTLTYSEHRYEPFWHVTGTAKYVYDRTVKHHWPASGPEVMSLSLTDIDYAVTDGKVTVSVLEHCRQEEQVELFVDGLSGNKGSHLKDYLKFSSTKAERADLEKLSEKHIVLPPQVRASALVRETASKMVHSIEADKIFEEGIEFDHVDLYYRPVFAYRFAWASKQKEAVVEVDALTKQVGYSQKSFQEYVGKVLDYDFLFDVGGDAVGMFVPGGSIAVKFAKKIIDTRHKK